MQRDDSRKDQNNRRENFEKRGKQNTFLTLSQVFCSKGPLNNLLVCAPVEKVEQEHPGKQSRPVHILSLFSKGNEGVWIVSLDLFEKSRNGSVPVSRELNGKPCNHDTTNEEAQPIKSVGNGNRSQSSESGI